MRICNDEMARGTCVAVLGSPREGRDPCPTASPDEPSQQAQCDGDNRISCAGFAAPDVVCVEPSCSNGVETTRGRCDGRGNCTGSEQRECGTFLCGATGCMTACSSDAGCAQSAICSATGKCVTSTVCQEDGHTLAGPDGTSDCAPFRCEESGTCRTACQSSAHCVEGSRCTTDGECVPSETAGARDEGGCGCRSAGQPKGSESALLLLLSGLGLAAGRWRRA